MDMDKNYHRIQKVSWDALWHAVYYRTKNGKEIETWDRVTEAQAIRISKKLAYADGLPIFS